MSGSCPWAKSPFSPCVRNHGTSAYGHSPSGKVPICVGCDKAPNVTGVPAPADWKPIKNKPEFDVQEVELIELDSDAVEVALEAATEANRAGDDDQAQLVTAIKAYVWACRVRGVKP